MSAPHLRPELTEPPLCIAALPRDKRGYPVPAFVDWINGEPEFRAMSRMFIAKAVRESLCWVCGLRIFGTERTFTVGPMCAINRVSSEPPSHRECARWSVMNCPFLSRPQTVRRENDPSENIKYNAGSALKHNPTVTLLWLTRHYYIEPDNGSLLFRLGNPFATEWFHMGQPATRQQALGGIGVGLPKLREMAELDGPEAVALLKRQYEDALHFLPKE